VQFQRFHTVWHDDLIAHKGYIRAYMQSQEFSLDSMFSLVTVCNDVITYLAQIDCSGH